jgi:AraC-like DNA-binding protein
MNDAEIRQLAMRLVDAFVSSLDENDPTPFLCTLQSILCRLEQTQGNTYPWGIAIEKLAQPDEVRVLIPASSSTDEIMPRVRTMIDQARTAVVESARRQRWRALYADNAEHALLTARLSTAFDEKQVLKVLAERVPSFGIRRLAIGIFESEGNDPFAWTQLRHIHDPDAPPLHLRSREHSPFDFFPADKGTQLVLTPLLIHQHIRGYIVFDADCIDLCAPVTYIVNAALSAVQAHREMIRLAHTGDPASLFATRLSASTGETPAITAAEPKNANRRGVDLPVVRTGKSKVILIADPDSGLLDAHTQLVHQKSKHYHVLQARDGKDAWSKIQDHLPDLVLLDLMLPQIDGFAILDAMHQFETTRRIPAIVTTCQPLGREGMARLNRGVAAVLIKGVFTPQETLACIIHTLSSDKPLNGEAQHLTRKAMGYIHDHYIRPIKRQDIARHVGVSDHHLSRYFQHAAGVPPMTYVTRYRVQRAKQLLESDTLNIADVATAVGFTNEFYFSRVFRRETGLTPSRYRRGAVSR